MVFFSPFAAIWAHAFPEALVAASLRDKGHDITYVWCDEVFKQQCVSMSAYGCDWRSSLEDRAKVCQRCQSNSQLIRGRFKFNSIPLSSLLDNVMEDIEQTISSMDIENPMGLQVDGFPVGQIASYELWIKYKKNEFSLNAEQLSELKISIRHVLLALAATTNLLDVMNPDRVIVYNGLYGIHRMVCIKAESKSVKSYFLHAGMNMANRMGTMLLGRGHQYQFIEELKSQWKRFRPHPCSQRQTALGFDHLREIMKGNSVFAYSNAPEHRDIHDAFGISSYQRILVATMSSYDEYIAAIGTGIDLLDESIVFRRQTDWVFALLRYMKNHSDLFLVIRVHPREFPNKREGRLSDHAQELKRLLVALPQNVCVNWPDDHISLYDIASEADLFLNGWSSVGEEMSLLGVPVLSYSKKLLGYPIDLNYIGETQEEYFNQLELALDDENALDRIRMTARWLAVKFYYGVFDIGDGYSDHVRKGMIRRILERGMRFISLFFREKQAIVQAKIPLKEIDRIEDVLLRGASTPLDTCKIERFSLEEETSALKQEIRKMISQFSPYCKLVRRLKPFLESNHG